MASKYLSQLSGSARTELEKRLLSMQQGLCFICETMIDYELQQRTSQTYEVWNVIFATRKSPQGQQVLAERLNLIKMAQS